MLNDVKIRAPWLLCGVLSLPGLLSGCATTGFPDVVEVRELAPSFGAPRIRRVRDVGSARIPSAGAWQGDSDGIASPGELLLIEGDAFGRQPTITIGGRATKVVARTAGGGVLVRVPPGVPTGATPISLAQPRGKVSVSFPLRRLAVAVHDGRVHVLSVDRTGAQPLGAPLAVPGAHLVRLSGDGSAAYLIARGAKADRLVVIDLAAAGGPRFVTERVLSHRVTMLSSALDAGVLAALGEGKLTVFVAPKPLQPAPYDPIELPEGARGARAAELSPDGRVLALLVPEGNRLVALDVARPPAVPVLTALDLLPTERAALVRDLVFSADGETLWIVSGSSAESLPVVQPTRLTAVRFRRSGAPEPAAAAAGAAPSGEAGHVEAGARRLLTLWRTQSIPGAAAPLHLAIARGQPLASGTTIRMPPEQAAVFVTTVHDALFQLAQLDLSTLEGARGAEKLWQPPQPGMMVRADINGGGGPLFSTRQLLSSVDLTPDAQLVMATGARLSHAPSSSSVVIDFGVTIAPVWGGGNAEFVSLGPLAPAALKPPFQLGEVRIQP